MKNVIYGLWELCYIIYYVDILLLLVLMSLN